MSTQVVQYKPLPMTDDLFDTLRANAVQLTDVKVAETRPNVSAGTLARQIMTEYLKIYAQWQAAVTNAVEHDIVIEMQSVAATEEAPKQKQQEEQRFAVGDFVNAWWDSPSDSRRWRACVIGLHKSEPSFFNKDPKVTHLDLLYEYQFTC